MRIVFMGTPDFAVPSLRALIEKGYEVVGVFTQPDKPKGRGHKLQPPPVKELALLHGIPVFQPGTLKTVEVQQEIAALAPDLIVVVAYGKMLPTAVLTLPPLGCINVHGSLLPKYRGAAPIQWAVLNGEPVTGCTTMYMAEGMDTGDMLKKAETSIGEEETAGELFDRLKEIGAKLLLDTLLDLEQNKLVPIPQHQGDATLAPMLRKEMSFLDWTMPARKLQCMIRGLNPWPVAVASYKGKRMKLYAARVVEGCTGPAGDLYTSDGELAVQCGSDALVITQLQTENGKRMSGKTYLLGHPLEEGAQFDLVDPSLGRGVIS